MSPIICTLAQSQDKVGYKRFVFFLTKLLLFFFYLTFLAVY